MWRHTSQRIFKSWVVVLANVTGRQTKRPVTALATNGQYFNTIPKFAKFYAIGFYGIIYSIVAQCAEKSNKNSNQPDINILINQSDEYFANGKYFESYDALYDLKDMKNPEVLWRLARALYNESKGKKVKTAEDRKKMIFDAYAYVREALVLTDQNYAVHKWMAILVDAKSEIEGTRARIENLPVFKNHLKIAMGLNPKDATSIYMLGQYCYSIAEMPWYQRKIASALFATPPMSSYEEALTYFERAEEVEPNFYSMNLLMLGKTYLKLNRLEPALYWLRCASNYLVRTEEDETVQKEAIELLRKNPWAKQKSKQKR